MSVILIFVDGLGLGRRDPASNPLASETVHLLSCFNEGPGIRRSGTGFLSPTDATLGVPGLPQSATGQATLLTGINCPAKLGRHLQGFPNASLREILKTHSVLKQVKDRGKAAAFLNAYRPFFFQLPENIQWRLSATTVANKAAGLPFSTLEDILKGKALYHDLTNEALVARGFDVPRFTPEKAGDILADSLTRYEFVLFEYFLTDKTGHSQDRGHALAEVNKLEHFVSAVLRHVDVAAHLVVVTSDHGNLEDLSVKTHTRNPVITLSWGLGAEEWASRIHSLVDITPAILGFLSHDREENAR